MCVVWNSCVEAFPMVQCGDGCGVLSLLLLLLCMEVLYVGTAY